MTVTGKTELRGDQAQLKRGFSQELQRETQAKVLLVVVNAETSEQRKDARELSRGAMHGTSQDIERLIGPVARRNLLLDRLDDGDASMLAGGASRALASRTLVPESTGLTQRGRADAYRVLLNGEIVQVRVRVQHFDQAPLREICA